MSKHLRPLPLLLPLLLAACVGVPTRAPHQPAIKPPTTAVLATPGIEVTPPTNEPLFPPSSNVWDQLRSSFAMADCDADPSVQAWARRYTHNPKQFEDQLQEVLPRLIYVQQVAAQYDVAGEFVLLPWVETTGRPAASAFIKLVRRVDAPSASGSRNRSAAAKACWANAGGR